MLLLSRIVIVIWVRIDKELCGEDIYLGTVYLSPSGKKENIVKIFQNFRQENRFVSKEG